MHSFKNGWAFITKCVFSKLCVDKTLVHLSGLEAADDYYDGDY